MAGAAYYVFRSPNVSPEEGALVPTGDIESFRDCVDLGYPVTQSLPRECRTPDGRIFIEGVDNPSVARVTGGCYIGGCGAEVCSDQPDVASNCIYKPEFACYQTGVCERQTGGECGWRQSPELVACLGSAAQSK